MANRRKEHSRRTATTTGRPWWVFAAVAVLVVVAGIGATLSFTGQGQPGGNGRVAVSPASVDLGAIRLNTPVEAVFHVSNSGTGPLRILGSELELIKGC